MAEIHGLPNVSEGVSAVRKLMRESFSGLLNEGSLGGYVVHQRLGHYVFRRINYEG